MQLDPAWSRRQPEELSQTEEEAAEGDVVVQAEAETDKAAKEDVAEKAETEEEEAAHETVRSGRCEAETHKLRGTRHVNFAAHTAV